MTAFSEDFLSEDDFEAVLATFGCYDYGASASEHRLHRYRSKRSSQMLLVCYSLLHSRSISSIAIEQVGY